MNLYSVSIKNKLERRSGERKVNVVKNEQDGVRYSILPGQDVQVAKPHDRIHLWSIKLEVEPMGPQKAIPIVIDSPGNYRITISQVDTRGKWTLEFNAPGSSTTAEPTRGNTPVNIAVGQDKSPAAFAKSLIFFDKNKKR